MSKLFPDPITQADIEEYLKDYSDFSFELRVLNELVNLGLHCYHGGTYTDPVTSKSREFDIRALIDKTPLRIHLSIECKNIGANFPLLMHCLQRNENESYNELIFTFDPFRKRSDFQYLAGVIPSNTNTYTLEDSESLYIKNDFVAKSADQVGRRIDKSIIATDGEVFEKISQAINSSIDLLTEAFFLNTEETNYLSLICPVLVVPDSRLWQIKYSQDGSMIGQPEEVNHISYFIGKECTIEPSAKLQPLYYTLSHVEIITFSEIQSFIENYLGKHLTIMEDTFNLVDTKLKSS